MKALVRALPCEPVLERARAAPERRKMLENRRCIWYTQINLKSCFILGLHAETYLNLRSALLQSAFARS